MICWCIYANMLTHTQKVINPKPKLNYKRKGGGAIIVISQRMTLNHFSPPPPFPTRNGVGFACPWYNHCIKASDWNRICGKSKRRTGCYLQSCHFVPNFSCAFLSLLLSHTPPLSSKRRSSFQNKSDQCRFFNISLQKIIFFSNCPLVTF